MDTLTLQDFFNLNEQQCAKLQPLITRRDLAKGEVLIKEGGTPDRFFLLEEGEVDVSRMHYSAPDPMYSRMYSKEQHIIKTWRENRIIGETGLFNSDIRTQTVTTRTKSVVYEIKYKDIDHLKHTDPELRKDLLLSLSEHLTHRLRESNTIIIETMHKKLLELKKRTYVSRLLLYMMIFVCIFLLAIDGLKFFYQIENQFLIATLTPTILTLLIITLFKVKYRPNLAFFGLTWKNWKRSLYEGLLLSITLIPCIILLKYVYIVLSGSQISLFTAYYTHQPESSMRTPLFIIEIFIYSLFCFPQELIARGMLQGPFELLFSGKYKIWASILISNLVFTALHIATVKFTVCIGVFISGLAWGWLYARNKTLLGVTLSHILVGVFSLFFLGVLT